MTTTLANKPVNILKKDNDDNWYSIPQNMEDEFIRLNEAIQNADFMSDEWWEASTEFDSTFEPYTRA